MTVTTKQPSPELLSLIKAAAQSLIGFGELWNSIKKKGHDEGFSEKELQDILRPLLKPQLNKDQIYYLFNADQKKEQSKQQYHRNIPKVLYKQDIEQTSIPEELPPNAPTKTAEEFYKEQEQEEEEPTELELANIRIAQLEDALHKTEQFVPATQLETNTKPVPILDDDTVFQYLKDRAMKTGDIIDFGRVGSGALVQVLAQYKGSFGVVELFGRVVKK